MAGHNLVFLSPAFADLDRIADLHNRLVGPKSAERITDKILETIDVLRNHPSAGALHPDPFLGNLGYRKIICGDYVCVYKCIDQTVVIHRIVHGATDYPKLLN